MGVVYRAVQLDLGRPVALKLIASDRAADPAFRERFQRESRMAAAIDHPNVVPVHGAGEEDGQLYLVMRFVPGTDLHRLVKAEGPLAPLRAAAIVAQVASALDAAHAAGLVHRDVKPANVLLAGDHAYLSDFGLTRLLSSEEQLTETGQWLGTTDFSSPEQLQGERVDARADVYSLGCVLHAALLGEPPFPRATVPATLLAHLQEPPPRPSTSGAPAGFDRVMARSLAKAPGDRYPSAGDLGRAALAAARGEHVTESERSVAVGSAAPGAPANGHPAPPPTAATVAQPPDTRVKDEARTEVIRPPRRSRRALVGGVVAVAALGTAAALSGIADGGGSDDPAAPLSVDEVRDVAQDFAQAYEDEDGRALRRLLTPGVTRVLPTGVARGRGRVVREYESQFRAQETQGYELEDLAVQGGRAGRASGELPRRARGPPRDRGPHRPRRGARPRAAADRADRGDAERLSAQQERATRTLTVVPRRTCLPGRGDCSQTPIRRGTSESRKPPPRSLSSLRSRRSASRAASSAASPTRSGTATRSSRVTRNAVSAAARPRAVAATSITFGPCASLTSELNVPPLTRAARPWTRTRAPAGLTRPLTSMLAPWTTAVSAGAEISSCTGFSGLGGGSSPPQPTRAQVQPAAMRVPSRTLTSQASLSPSSRSATVLEHMFVRPLSH